MNANITGLLDPAACSYTVEGSVPFSEAHRPGLLTASAFLWGACPYTSQERRFIPSAELLLVYWQSLDRLCIAVHSLLKYT